MNDKTWPKEVQRMCNGASGQVPATARDDDVDAFEKKRRQAAINTEVDALWLESVARNHVGLASTDHQSASEQAVMLLSLVLLDVARTLSGAIREGTTKIEAAILDAGAENAGAIDSTGKVIGVGLAEGLKTHCKGRPCRRGT